MCERFGFHITDHVFPPQNVSTRVHKLNLPFTGSANVIFNGSFIYYNKAKEAIVKLDLATKDERCLVIPRGRQTASQKRQVSFLSFEEILYNAPRLQSTRNAGGFQTNLDQMSS